MKKLLVALAFVLFISTGCARTECNETELAALPAPEFAEGIRGEQFEIDKNINEDTIDQFLDRPDTVYRDMRMLVDPAAFEEIGGDSYLSGFVRGFEVVPLPYIVNVTLPPAVGETRQGKTLFTRTDDGEYIANFEESMEILEWLFPKDKNIFLMCGGGGYARNMRRMLIALGWDENVIYNVGAHWSYEGDNNIPVRNIRNGQETFDFWKVTYHRFDFRRLQEIN